MPPRPYASHEDERDGKDHLVKDLNNAIANWSAWLSFDVQAGGSAIVSTLYAHNRAREEIDALLAGYIMPGARLELDDGLWTPNDVARSFPNDWEGIADFICCTSVYLSEVLKKNCRRAMFRADSRLLKPRLVIPALWEILQRMIQGTEPADYMEFAYEADRQWSER